MKILSISIDERALERLNAIQKKLGIKSRSKMLRNAVLSMLNEYETLEMVKGTVESVFIITYKEQEKNNVSDMLHRYGGMIKTDLHQHGNGIGIEIVSISTDADGIRKLFGSLKGSKSVYSVTYSVIKSA